MKIALEIERGYERGDIVEYTAAFPDGKAYLVYVANDRGNDIERAKAFQKAADLWLEILQRQVEMGYAQQLAEFSTKNR